MKKFLQSSIMFLGMALFLGSCESPDKINMDLNQNNTGISSIKVTFMDGKGEFYPDVQGPYHDGAVINISVPWFFPVESNNETNIERMRIFASLPNGVVCIPALTTIDLTKDNVYTIINPDGTQEKITIRGQRKKSSDKLITKFTIKSANVSGFVIQGKNVIGLYADGKDVSNAVATFEVSPHATITPDPSIPQDFTKPITYTVTALDGSSQTYTTDPTFVPTKLKHGLRRESVRKIWYQSFADMGIDPANNMTTSIAVTDKYLFVNTRNQDCKYYDRFTGKYAGTIVLPFKNSSSNFFMTSDEDNNILITNLKGAASGNQTIYRIKGGEVTPEKYIDVAHGYITGRKLSIRGSLDKDAIITSSVVNSKDVLYWEVKGGVLVSQTPNKISIDSSIPNWTYLADVSFEEPQANSGLFVCGYPSKFGYFNANGKIGTLFDLAAAGYNGNYATSSIDYVEFNGDRYLGQNIHFIYGATVGAIYDVTNSSNLALPHDDPRLLMFKDSNVMTPTANNNATGDVLFKVSKDGLKLTYYIMATNGGVAAYEFDCLDIPK